jgi:hypothetical protein
MTLEQWVDGSFDPLTAREATCLKEKNVGGYVQCAWTGSQSPQEADVNLRIAKEQGLEVAAYASLTRYGTGQWHMEKAVRALSTEMKSKLRFLAVDVELQGIRASAIRDAVRYVQDQSHLPAVIYTSYNAWRNYVVWDIPDTFGWTYLWNANWDGNPDIDFPSLSFGRWEYDKVAIEQWSGGTMQCGQYVDRNTVVRELVIPAPEEKEEDEMFLVNVARPGGLYTYAVDAAGKRHLTPAEAPLYARKYGAPIAASVAEVDAVPNLVAYLPNVHSHEIPPTRTGVSR